MRKQATLLNSMRKDLRSIAISGMTAKELWDAIKVKYGKQSLADSEHHLPHHGQQKVH